VKKVPLQIANVFLYEHPKQPEGFFCIKQYLPLSTKNKTGA